VAARCGALDRHGGVVAVPFKETLPEVELGLATMERADTVAIANFRQVVMQCAGLGEKRAVQKRVPVPVGPAVERRSQAC